MIVVLHLRKNRKEGRKRERDKGKKKEGKRKGGRKNGRMLYVFWMWVAAGHGHLDRE